MTFFTNRMFRHEFDLMNIYFDSNALHCKNCETTMNLRFPAPVPFFLGQIEGFVLLHRDCKPSINTDNQDEQDKTPS